MTLDEAIDYYQSEADRLDKVYAKHLEEGRAEWGVAKVNYAQAQDFKQLVYWLTDYKQYLKNSIKLDTEYWNKHFDILIREWRTEEGDYADKSFKVVAKDGTNN